MRISFNVFILILSLFSCQGQPTSKSESTLTDSEKEYWYSGKAEVNSYSLKQARYGQLREGKAVLIFVTEPFNVKSFTKADDYNDSSNINVLKVNATKSFNTGIYPYSMMTSTFYPVQEQGQSIKITSSIQEWCGQQYMEMDNTKKMKFAISSYFEGENKDIKKDIPILEDDIWSMIRLDYQSLPQGDIEICPSFFYLRLKHKEVDAYQANATIAEIADKMKYTITYPTLNRSVSYTFEADFPHKILQWEETYPDGPQAMTTTASLLESAHIDYWNMNSKAYDNMRDSMQLK